MSDDLLYVSRRSAPLTASAKEPSIFGWLRWWHWLILVLLGLFAVAYFPLWRFEQRWRQIKVGDSVDELGDWIERQSAIEWTGSGLGPEPTYHAYEFRVYWKTYELFIAPGSRRVFAKEFVSPTQVGLGPNVPAVPPNVRKKR